LQNLGEIALRECEGVLSPVIARSDSDEAIQLSCRGNGSWIASRSLSSGAHSRDPVARNDGVGRFGGTAQK